MEQNAAWEAIEAKANVKEGNAKEKFVSASYMKQLELQRLHKVVVDAEEAANEKKGKVANSETQMMGFYKNFIGRVTGSDPEIAKDKKEDVGFKARVEAKLDEIKAQL